MVRKIIRDLLIVLGIGVMFISTNRTCMEWISDRRYKDASWYGEHDPLYGGLVKTAYLDHIDKFRSPNGYDLAKPTYDTSKNINLFLLGDSYTFFIPDSSFADLNNYKHVWWWHGKLRYWIDTSKANVLILQICERNMRWHLGSPDELQNTVVRSNNEQDAQTEDSTDAVRKEPWEFECMFNKDINQNLEYNIFNYNFLKFFRSEKGALTYHLFQRGSGDVVVSKDDTWLFLKQTVDTATEESSYKYVSNDEIDRIVTSLNTLDEHFKQSGFDEVYFSLIPNPASLVQPQGYNYMIPRIQENPKLEATVVNYYDQVKQNPRPYCRPGDNHWSNAGINVWVKEVNDLLAKANDEHLAKKQGK